MSVSSLSRLVCTNERTGMPCVHFPQKNELPASYALFRKIRDCVSNEHFWKNLMVSVNKEICKSPEPSETIATSCVMNQFLLNILLLGEDQAKKVMDILKFTISEVSTYKAADDSKKIDLIFFHLLSGNAVIHLNKKFQDPSYQYVKQDVLNSLKDSKEYIIPLEIFKENVRKMKPCIYDYNHHVINALEAEIKENSSKVSPETSFLYHVAITGPDLDIAENASKGEVISAPTRFFHTFVLEQYYSPHLNRDMMRLHQSWKKIMTLGEYYEKANYDDQDQGCMDYGDVKNFFDDFRGLHSYDIGPEYPNLKKCLLACFNVDLPIKPAAVFRLNINVFTGHSVRYVTSKINPQECLHNIDEVLNKYGNKA